ncbi:Putative uncharacterized protein [Moritella viscosa]|nr:Putative uncharacterized protein [Moritella viscosa]
MELAIELANMKNSTLIIKQQPRNPQLLQILQQLSLILIGQQAVD